MVIFIGIIAVINSCKKDSRAEQQNNINDPAVVAAKKWYDSTYPTNNNKLNTQSTATSLDFTRLIKPDWQHSNSYVRYDDDVIEMPIDVSTAAKFGLGLKSESGETYQQDYSRSSFLLIKQLGKYNAYVMTIIADPTYLKGDLTKLDHNKYNKRDSDFSGVVLYSTPNGKFVNGWFYKNGLITGNITPGIQPASTGQPSDRDQTTQDIKTNTNTQKITVCTEWWQIATYAGGNSGLVYLGEKCVMFTVGGAGGTGGSTGGSTGGNGGGGGDGTGTGTPAPSTTPCIPAVLNSVGGQTKTAINSYKHKQP